MKQKIKTLIKHPLIWGSGIVVFGNLLVNFFNFLFNLFMSRSLTVSEYGVLASIMSLIVFPALVGGAVLPVVITFAGDYFAKSNFARLRGLYRQIKKMMIVIGVLFFVIFFLLSSEISTFFHIHDHKILFMTNIIIFLSLISVINIAFLQAKLAFGFQVLVGFINAVTKLIAGVIFVFLGYSVAGATLAMIVGGTIAYIVSFFPLSFLFEKKETAPSISAKEIFLYGMPSSLTILGMTSIISADIMLVKHFFSAHEAGLYAGLSLIARVIFYVSAPIGGVMFPMIVQKHSKNENFTSIFKFSLLLVLIPSILLTTFYFLFPNFSILFFLKREEYLVISPYLVPFALLTSLYGVLSIISNFYLSIKKTKIFIPIISGALLQIVLIYFFHENFWQIITISLSIIIGLICLLLCYYRRAVRRS